MPLLYYKNESIWYPIPRWAQFFLQLGQMIGAKELTDNRVIAGMMLPTRAYAAAFIASGMNFGKHSTFTSSKNSHEHFTMLCNLPFGTSVIYRYQNSIIKGFLEGTEEIDGEIRIKIRVESQRSGSLSHWVNKNLALAVDVSDRQFERLPNHQTGKRIREASKFLQIFLGSQNTRQFINYSQINCIIIGSLKDLENEITSYQFGIKNLDETMIEGSIQDIIGVRRWVRNGEVYRSDIYPGNRLLNELPKNTHTIIFDTASSFLRYRSRFPTSNWVIILDRADPYVDDAIHIINQGYIDHQMVMNEVEKFPLLPPGCEYIIYEEER